MSGELDLIQKIATPTRVGQHIGRDLWGHDYIPYPFILELEHHVVDAIMSPESKFLMANAPPQTGKTSFSGVLLPFWFIGMFPDKQVIFITYSDDYSRTYGRIVRDLFKKYGEELFGLTIDPNTDGAGDWKIKDHPAGGMLSVGIGSQITGRSGHLVIVDDVIKNMEEAASVAIKRKHVVDWDGTILTRRQPGCTYLITATRFAEDDLSGSLWERTQKPDYTGDTWTRITFPAICEVPDDWDGPKDQFRDLLGRAPDDPLECRFSQPDDSPSRSHFHQLRNTIEPFTFACLYQQDPVSKVGGMFPRDHWTLEPRESWADIHARVRAWDLAATEGGGDWTVGTLMGRGVDGRYYVIGRQRFRKSSDKVMDEVRSVAQADGRSVPILIEQERSGSGSSTIAFYQKELAGFPVQGVRPEGSKETRAHPYSVLQQGGNIVLPSDPEDSAWVREWIVEHGGMMGDGRRPRHDDQIDTGSYAVRYLLQHGLVEIVDPNMVELTPKDVVAMDELLSAYNY